MKFRDRIPVERFPWEKKEPALDIRKLAGIGLGFGVAALWYKRQRRKMNFRHRVAVITGGSRGLGLEMARQLAGDGARLAILARNEPELQAAYEELIAKGAEVLTINCDVGVREQVERAIRQVADQYGRIDVLINNAGVVQVGPVDHMRVEDYENAMAVHFWGPLYAMLAVIPIMRRQGAGRIVNISSIGGRVAVPHLAPYDASKFALTGLSNAFRAELARDNILITTVTPGLMRTGSYYHGNYKGDNEKEFSWFTLMSSTPATAMSSRRAARAVINAARYGEPKQTLTLQARLVELLDVFAPNLSAWSWRMFNRVLPSPTGDQGNELRTGFESRSGKAPSIVSRLGERAAERNNEKIAEKF